MHQYLESENNLEQSNNKYKILLPGLVIISLIFQILIFLMYPYLYGVDGAYYELQVRSILQTGQMWTGDNPFVFYYFALLSFLTQDIVLAIKIGICIFCSLIPIPTYLIINKLTKDDRASIFSAFISVFNPLLFRLMGEFVKNAIGCFFLLCFIYFFLLSCEKDNPIKKQIILYLTTYGFLVLIIYTHIYPTGYAACFVIVYLIYSIIHSKLKKQKFPLNEIKIGAFLCAGGIITLLFIFFFFNDFFTHFLKIEAFIEQMFGISLTESTGIVQLLQAPPGFGPMLPPMFMPMNSDIIPLVVLIPITCIGIAIIVYDLIKKKKSHPLLQFIGFCLIFLLPVYYLVPSNYQMAGGFTMFSSFADVLNIFTYIPVLGGVSLLVLEIYKNDPNKFEIDRLKGILLAVFITSSLLVLPFINNEWSSRFSYMNFIPIALLMGYGIKALKDEDKRKKILAISVIGFFCVSFFAQTAYFCSYQMSPTVTTAGMQDLEALRVKVDTNSSLKDSIVLLQNLDYQYYTILKTGLTTYVIYGTSIDASYYADYYNETIFIIYKISSYPALQAGQEVIRNETNGQFFIILANYTYHD